MPAVEVAALGALPKKIVQLVKQGLFFAKIVMEGLKHGLLCFDLPWDVRNGVLDGVVNLVVIVVVIWERIVRGAVASLHDEHDRGKCRSFQQASKPFVSFHILIF